MYQAGSAQALRLLVPRQPFLVSTFQTASDPALLPEPLVLSGLDVGINLLVDKSADGPSFAYGVGLMFTVENPQRPYK